MHHNRNNRTNYLRGVLLQVGLSATSPMAHTSPRGLSAAIPHAGDNVQITTKVVLKQQDNQLQITH